MSRKLKKILDEIEKADTKIAEWQARREELDGQRKLMEDAEIVKGIRSMKLDSRTLLAVLDGIQNGTISFSHENAGNPGGCAESGNGGKAEQKTGEDTGDTAAFGESTEDASTGNEAGGTWNNKNILPEDTAGDQEDEDIESKI